MPTISGFFASIAPTPSNSPPMAMPGAGEPSPPSGLRASSTSRKCAAVTAGKLTVVGTVPSVSVVIRVHVLPSALDSSAPVKAAPAKGITTSGTKTVAEPIFAGVA